MKQLVTTEWLEKNINKVKILDATWCLPNSGRNAEEEFKENHSNHSDFSLKPMYASFLPTGSKAQTFKSCRYRCSRS